MLGLKIYYAVDYIQQRVCLWLFFCRCFSYIGKVIPNGQDLSIGNGCDDISVVEHEFMHALGFYHEQSRYDRDEYVRIVWENILNGMIN